MSEARADLPASPGASAMGLSSGLSAPSGGDVVLPNPAVAASPPAIPIPTDNDSPQGRSGASDPLAPVMDRIARGETGGNSDPYTAKYGGGNFGFPDWEGRPGPEGVSHAAGKYQFEPATWNAAAADMVAHGLPKPDFKNPADQERVARFWAVKTYHDKTGRNLIDDAQRDRVDYSALTGQWPSLSPNHLGNQLSAPVGGSAIRERMAAFERDVTQQSERDRAEYERIASQTDPGSKERSELMGEARARAAQAREMYEDFAKHPPAEKPIDALQNFGSIGTMLALLIGGMGRHHMNGALAAAGAMMQAAQANNHELFERQYKIWDHQSTMALNLAHLEGDEVRNLLEDKRMSENERQAKLHAFYEEHQMTYQAQQMRGNMMERALQADQHAWDAAHSAAQKKLEFGQMMFQIWLQSDEGKKATPDQVDQKAALYGVIGGRAAAGAGAGQFSKDAIDALVQQAMTVGPAGIMPSLPRSGPARAQFENAFAERLKQEPGGIEGGTAKVIMNQMRMAEAKSAASSAGRITMNTELYSQEAAGAGKMVIEASKAFPRTNIPKFNEALAAYERGTGDPNIIAFGTAINSLVNAYGKMTNPTGTGIHDADKESLRHIMDTSLSQGQIEAGVEQILKEGRNVSSAAQKAQEEVLSHIVPGASPTTGAAPTPSASPSTSSPQGVPVPAEHASDPDGTTYKGSDGKTYVKRGNQMAPQ